jgi:ribonucleoside-diphosphate reductase alpha chain
MDFRETERVEMNDVATMELAKNDAPAASESKPDSPTTKLNDAGEPAVHARRFDVTVDRSRDSLLTDFGKETLRIAICCPARSYQDLFARVAAAYADDAAHAQRLYDYISKLWFMPATPVLSNGGTGRGLPISCYLNSVDDSLEGIVGTWNENVWLASRGGGIGTYWGNVRGIGEPVGLNGKTSGIIPFVRVMDSLTLAISQGSLRRGSAACYLDISHPEIEEFLEVRKPSGDFNRKALNLHHGVLITDEFMEAVRDGASSTSSRPRTAASAAPSTRARCSRSWSKPASRPASPTSSSSDHVNRMMPKHHRDLGLKVSTSNLCSEITLPTGKDHLGQRAHRGLLPLVAQPRNLGRVEGDKGFIEDVMRFLDNVLQDYIDRAEPGEMARAKYSAARERSVGLGVMGFHSFLQARGLPFEGAMAKTWNLRDLQAHPRAGRSEASMLLARSAGPAPTPPIMGVMERFSCKMAIAPTASISIICGGTSACIEPIPANIYTHKTLSGSFSVKNPYLEALLDRKVEEQRQCLELDPRARRQRPAPRLPHARRKRTASRPASRSTSAGCSNSRRPHALYRSGPVAEPVHPGRCREVGSADAPLPRVGARHQVALLSPQQIGAARRVRGGVEADNTPRRQSSN